MFAAVALALPAFTVERSSVEPEAWSVYAVDLAGGIGPRVYQPQPTRHQAEAWARAFGRLVEPYDEAA